MSLPALPIEVVDAVCTYLNPRLEFELERSAFYDNDFFSRYLTSNLNDDTSDNHDIDQNARHDTYSSMQVTRRDYSRRDLLNLSLVSSQFHRAVEPHLYSVFDQTWDAMIPFMHQITQKPCRRNYVRCLRIEPKGDKYNWQSFPGCDLELTSRLLSDIIHRATMASGDCSWIFSLPYTIKEVPRQQEIFAQWLILHLPQCETIKISLPHEWDFKLLRWVAKHDTTFCSRLRYLHILGPPVWQISRLYPNVPETVTLDPVGVLLGLERLEEICFDYCATTAGTDKPRVMAPEINHWGCVSSACEIKDVLSTCTDIRYHELDYDDSAALDLSYLSLSCETLQRLVLQVDRLSPNSLRTFSQLWEVIFHACSFDRRRPGTKWVPNEQQSAAWDAPVFALAAMLPPCLKVLQLNSTTPADAKRVWQDRLHFMISRVARSFPNLKTVNIAWEPSDELRQACSSNGVQLLIHKNADENMED